MSSLRSVCSRFVFRWPWVAALVLLGALLGWAAARLAPPQYRASAELYVGLHAYRAPEENGRNVSSYYDFRNLDDFKNWQLEQLDQFARRDAVVAETLARLRAQDPAWRDVTASDLQSMLSLQWRTVGKWRLTVTAPAPRLAEQAAETWRLALLDALEAALQSSAEVMRLDAEMQALLARQAALISRSALLRNVRSALLAWRTATAARPLEAPLSPARRWALRGMAVQAAAPEAGWQALLEAFPPPDASAEASLLWSGELLAAIEAEQAALPEQRAALRNRFEALDAQYAAAEAASCGLSRNLSLEGISSLPVQARQVRSAGAWALTGAVLGMACAALGWLLVLGAEAEGA